MNFFFLLKNNIPNLKSEIDLINFSPSLEFSKSKSQDSILHIVYSDGNEWIYKDLCKLPKNETITISEDDIDNSLKNHSIYFSINKNKISKSDYLLDEKYHVSSIAWRANIKIRNNKTTTSYQGEYPGGMTKKNISLVSCSPMIQNKKLSENYFYLVNLHTNPKITKFDVNILDSKKNKLTSLKCYTNNINFFNLNNLNLPENNNMFIFQSDNGGGIPIYFSQDKNGQMSLEHTHPPTEYVLHGNRFLFQKIKKNFWRL